VHAYLSVIWHVLTLALYVAIVCCQACTLWFCFWLPTPATIPYSRFCCWGDILVVSLPCPSCPLVAHCRGLICSKQEPSALCPTPKWCHSIMCAFCSPLSLSALSILKQKSCVYPCLCGSTMRKFPKVAARMPPEVSCNHQNPVPPHRPIPSGSS